MPRCSTCLRAPVSFYIEALSRGATHCDFVEHNKAAYGIVSKTSKSARVKDKAALHRTEAAEFVAKAGGNGTT